MSTWASIAAAADELHLTQSAVSQRVLKLETHVGQRLFIRQGHGVRLTGAGELLMETATDTLQRLRAGFARIEPYRNKQSLLLACPYDFAHGWLLPRLEALRAARAWPRGWPPSRTRRCWTRRRCCSWRARPSGAA